MENPNFIMRDILSEYPTTFPPKAPRLVPREKEENISEIPAFRLPESRYALEEEGYILDSILPPLPANYNSEMGGPLLAFLEGGWCGRGSDREYSLSMERRGGGIGQGHSPNCSPRRLRGDSTPPSSSFFKPTYQHEALLLPNVHSPAAIQREVLNVAKEDNRGTRGIREEEPVEWEDGGIRGE